MTGNTLDTQNSSLYHGSSEIRTDGLSDELQISTCPVVRGNTGFARARGFGKFTSPAKNFFFTFWGLVVSYIEFPTVQEIKFFILTDLSMGRLKFLQ